MVVVKVELTLKVKDILTQTVIFLFISLFLCCSVEISVHVLHRGGYVFIIDF